MYIRFIQHTRRRDQLKHSPCSVQSGQYPLTGDWDRRGSAVPSHPLVSAVVGCAHIHSLHWSAVHRRRCGAWHHDSVCTDLRQHGNPGGQASARSPCRAATQSGTTEWAVPDHRADGADRQSMPGRQESRECQRVREGGRCADLAVRTCSVCCHSWLSNVCNALWTMLVCKALQYHCRAG